MNTARRAAEIQPFEVMDVLSRAHALERAGRHVVHMEIGEPDFTAPALYVDAGDEVLVPDPGYPGYRHFVRAFEGRARALPVSAADNFQPTLTMVQSAWGARTKGLVLGSPSNPTGTLIERAELARIAEFIAGRGGVLIVDEIYQ